MTTRNPSPAGEESLLRKLIADALTNAAFECDGKCGLSEKDCYDAHPIMFSAMSNGVTDVNGSVTSIADVVLPVLMTHGRPVIRTAVLRECADDLSRKANALTEGIHDKAIFVAKPVLAEAEILDREVAELRARAVCPACDAGIDHDVHCPAPESHNWGCGCPTDQIHLHTESGVDTPGCDCGHEGMGQKWHRKQCAWVISLDVPHPDDEGDELVCVDECGSCDACGIEPFGTPAEGWRQAAHFLRRTARESGDRDGALCGAQLIEAELRRLAETSRPRPTAPYPSASGPCTNCRGSGFDPRYNGDFACPDCPPAAVVQPDVEARPRCPHCRLPHDLTPGSLAVAMCENVRQRIAVEDALTDRYGEDHSCSTSGCSGEPGAVPQPDQEAGSSDRVVAHVLSVRTDLRCLVCAPPPWGDIWTPVTAEELEDGGMCSKCGVDLLIPQSGEETS